MLHLIIDKKVEATCLLAIRFDVVDGLEPSPSESKSEVLTIILHDNIVVKIGIEPISSASKAIVINHYTT